MIINSVDAYLKYSEEVEKLLSDCTVPSSTEFTFVALIDLQECISKLQPVKAVSFDGIYNEHYVVPSCLFTCVSFSMRYYGTASFLVTFVLVSLFHY